MTDLILTEKYSVAADFAKAFGIRKKGKGCFEGNGYIITWAVGHLVELYKPEDYDTVLKKWRLETLPVIPDKFRYKPIKQNIKQLNVIKRLFKLRKFNQVIIATDAGREGEVIARTILLEAGFTDKQRIKRFWTSQALVPEVIHDTMNRLKPVTDYDRLWIAGYYRQVADWLVGMNCTRVLTVRLKDLFSVGRVQTAVLALLVDRKKERDCFIPETYWIIKAVFKNDKGWWTGNWYKKRINRLTKKEEVDSLIRKISSETVSGTVLSVEKQKKKEPPPFLFSLTDLQQQANNRYGFSAKRSLDIAQRLYQDKKCLSYPRTDSKVLGTKNLNLVKDVIEKLKNVYKNIFHDLDYNKLSLSNKRVFNDNKLTDHHALIPFKPLPANVSNDEKKIFDLVLKRFAAAFHPDCEFEQTKIITEFSNETFKTSGKVILSYGWRSVYGEQDKEKSFDKNSDFILKKSKLPITDDKKEKSKKKHSEVQIIPPLIKGDPAKLDKVIPEEKQTVPPPDYTDALMLKDMTNPGKFVSENQVKQLFRGEVGIGTQSTRAQIIETLLSREYAGRSGKTIIAREKGVFLIETLRKTQTSTVLTSPSETARWETSLNKIALGEQTDARFLNHVKEFVTNSVNELKIAQFDQTVLKNRLPANNLKFNKTEKNAQALKKKSEIIECLCPVCGVSLIEGKKGYGCSNWKPENGGCSFVIWKNIFGKKLTKKNVKTLLNGKISRSYVFKGNDNKKFKGKMKMSKKNSNQFVITIIPDIVDTTNFLMVMPCKSNCVSV